MFRRRKKKKPDKPSALQYYYFFLPPELLIKIFSYLQISDMFAVALVCRDWEIVAIDNHLWFHFFNRDVEKSIFNADHHYAEFYANQLSIGKALRAMQNRNIAESSFRKQPLSDSLVTITLLADLNRFIHCFLEYRLNDEYYIVRIFFSSEQYLKGEYIVVQQADDYSKRQLCSSSLEYSIGPDKILCILDRWLNYGVPEVYKKLNFVEVIKQLLHDSSCLVLSKLNDMAVDNFLMTFKSALEKAESELASRAPKQHRRCLIS